jgi:hypothetical protein
VEVCSRDEREVRWVGGGLRHRGLVAHAVLQLKEFLQPKCDAVTTMTAGKSQNRYALQTGTTWDVRSVP